MIKKHKITVTLDWASINKDVHDKAFRMARLAKLGAGDTAAGDRLESEITLGDEDMGLLKRAMAQGLAEVVTMCGEYVWSTSHTSDNYIIAAKDVTLTLMTPLNFNLAGCESLGQMVHAYIVAKALTEWFRYTVPARAAEQQALQDAAGKEIRKILNARVRLPGGMKTLQIIVGDVKPAVEMLYYTDNEVIEEMPTDEDMASHRGHATTERNVRLAAGMENPISVAVALPLGYTPLIGGRKADITFGKIVHDDKVYVWWGTSYGRFEADFTITY